MISFSLNGVAVETPGEGKLLSYLREVAGLPSAKLACGEGVCGACSVIVDGKLQRACVLSLEKLAGARVLTLEGLVPAEAGFYAECFARAGAVQCGFCTPGMVLAAKVLLDSNPHPTEAQVRAGIRINLCRCTGYAKIVAAILDAAGRREAALGLGPGPLGATPNATLASGGGGPEGDGVGSSLLRVDALEKALGRALYVDDLPVPGALVGAVLRPSRARARLLALDATAARAIPGVVVIATAQDIPGKRYTGHIIPDWPTLVALGEECRYVGDAVALVAAETKAAAQAALAAIQVKWEGLEPLRSPEDSLAPGAPRLHPEGNILSRLELKRGDAAGALARASHLVEGRWETPFTDHAFLEPESALAFPPDADGILVVHTGEQNVYSGRKYIADTLGIPQEKVRVVSAYVGGAFGGKEDQSVQHHAALLAWLAGRPVRLTLSREESTRVHVKRHAMKVSLSLGCDAQGKLVGLRARIVADTGAYASLGAPVLQRAVIHVGGPYAYQDVDIEGLAVYTNNPPAGAFRGFGVPQVSFALESALNLLAAKAGLSPWEIRYRNAIHPGQVLPNGQVAGPDAALEECLLAVKPAIEAARGPWGLACGFKNVGLGVGHRDVGRCILRVRDDHVEVLTGAACIGQGLATVLTQVASSVLGLDSSRIKVAPPDTGLTPDSGTTTASRQTLITGEACRRACEAAAEALRARVTPAGQAWPWAALAGQDFAGEYEAATDPFDSKSANPIRHVAYSYAVQFVELGAELRLARVVAAHDSGLIVNPLAFEGQVEGGVAMGLGYALTEDLPLVDCVPPAKFGRLGLLRAVDLPPIETIPVRKAGAGDAQDGGVSGAAWGPKGIGEISTIPTAAAVAGAYLAADGLLRPRLPLEDTPYSRGKS